MSETILEMRGITKRFGGVAALSSVSIDLRASEIHAIVGENGAGKSTLMKILSGSYPHGSYEGEIWIGGRRVQFSTPSDAVKSGIEMIYQEISMHLDLSVAENIFLGRMPKKRGTVDWKAAFRNAKKYTDMVGLDVSVRQTLRDLSTSRQQMVAIARALSRDPKILVLDEPTSALTESEVETLFDNLFRLKERGISCIYITHKMKEVMRLADRVTVLRDGRHISTRSRAEVTIDSVIEEMVNRKIGNLYPKQAVPLGGEALRVEELTVAHPYSTGKNIVDHVSFSVRRGEILGIVGLVGAGRSELVSGIVGAIPIAGGRVFVDGKPVSLKNPRRAIRRGVALLSEDRKVNGYVPTMDIAQNVSLASIEQIADRSILRPKRERDFARKWIGELSIRARSEKDNIMSLSGGNQQKVVLAKWLMTRPGVLLLDEPTRGIDVGAKAQIYEIMTALARQGMAIVMISSELPELVGMCDRFIVLSEGRRMAEFQRGEADEEKFLKVAAGG
ncbi:MAG: Xylose import ATP-binding protein XylG [Firmicutes bacterium ADurb.Bin467]|nr:MAG: Xylose import ATP-binding protein XylG [Firmicutes bacterium ADurb.Bin467]